jgi:hypothetical protein
MAVDHVIRDGLPWRRGHLPERAECWRDLSTIDGDLITRAEWQVTYDEYTALRESYRVAGMRVPSSVRRPNICRTCWETCEAEPSWERNPIGFLRRQVHLRFTAVKSLRNEAEEQQTRQELWALAQLAERHRREFDALVNEMSLGYRRDNAEV